jgi:hypothetical protein
MEGERLEEGLPLLPRRVAMVRISVLILRRALSVHPLFMRTPT